MKKLLLFSVLLLVACQKAPESTKQIGEYNIQKLFTYENCTVYRFIDDRTVYFTNCNGETQSDYSCGKGCVRTDQVRTTK